ncbi:MAG TPA: phytoene desaturase family protein [Myxococcota bacterium]|nr:phytoene desaturase family protein [Myxococcota bacterium]
MRSQRATRRVVVIGAGIGGLAAAVELAREGLDVVVVERRPVPGGKMREAIAAGRPIDSGPTVFTMRRVFDELFECAGASLEAALTLRRADVLARHAWGPGERLDLHADIARSSAAIGEFAGAAEARRFDAFAASAQGIYRTLEQPYLRSPRPTPLSLTRRIGFGRLGELWRIRPFTTLWRALDGYFRDPRLRQLFGRYATYCGSSPFLAPATLMLVAHVEQDGVWLVEGGMQRLAEALAALAGRLGVRIEYGTAAAEILVERGRTGGVRLDDGRRHDADAVVANADVAALAQGLLGSQVSRAVPPVPASARSLSAITWSLVGRAAGFPLLRHNVFFAGDYAAEFDDLFRRRQVPGSPTVYVCAQDRADVPPDAPPAAAERLMCLINAPATGDDASRPATEFESCEERTFRQLERCGLEVHRTATATVTTTPRDFARMFPGTGGALYGQASHGWQASFRRPGSRSRIPGLYLAGGSTHPGPGVPMAALSGRLAAASLIEDLASTAR